MTDRTNWRGEPGDPWYVPPTPIRIDRLARVRAAAARLARLDEAGMLEDDWPFHSLRKACRSALKHHDQAEVDEAIMDGCVLGRRQALEQA